MATSPAQVDPALPGTICDAGGTRVKQGPRRTQREHLSGRTNDDGGGAQLAGAAGGAARV
jgi:hypothetical protein